MLDAAAGGSGGQEVAVETTVGGSDGYEVAVEAAAGEDLAGTGFRITIKL